VSGLGLQLDVAIFGNQPVPTIVRQGRLAESLGYGGVWIIDSQLIWEYDYFEHASAAARHRTLVPERLIDLFALAGTAAEVAERVGAISGVPGLQRLVMVPQVPGQGFVEREELLREFADTVMGRVG
jgi:alkanesulfonate monooxygenase SsuD/methylene tetrahydromethanopterin reductase-like flavin-dependent oxidoreductase (luciferase family)